MAEDAFTSRWRLLFALSCAFLLLAMPAFAQGAGGVYTCEKSVSFKLEQKTSKSISCATSNPKDQTYELVTGFGYLTVPGQFGKLSLTGGIVDDGCAFVGIYPIDGAKPVIVKNYDFISCGSLPVKPWPGECPHAGGYAVENQEPVLVGHHATVYMRYYNFYGDAGQTSSMTLNGKLTFQSSTPCVDIPPIGTISKTSEQLKQGRGGGPGAASTADKLVQNKVNGPGFVSPAGSSVVSAGLSDLQLKYALNPAMVAVPGPQPTAAPGCTDSDGGVKLDVKGAVTYNGQVREDHCNFNDRPANTKANEFHCFRAYPLENNWITCPYGCSDGACLSAPTPTPKPHKEIKQKGFKTKRGSIVESAELTAITIKYAVRDQSAPAPMPSVSPVPVPPVPPVPSAQPILPAPNCLSVGAGCGVLPGSAAFCAPASCQSGGMFSITRQGALPIGIP